MSGAMDEMRHDLLLAYAAGRLPEPLALAVATHVALNRTAYSQLLAYEALGGSFLEELDDVPPAPGSLEAVLARLDAPAPPVPVLHGLDQGIPAVLARHLPAPLDELPWVWRGPLSEYPLLTDIPGYDTRFFRLKAGWPVPRHTHEGTELTVVIRGAYRDNTGSYRRGDLALADASVDHRPWAERGEDCYCLAVTDAGRRLTDPVLRLLNGVIRV
ncbi:ChrR family anti-sigma-E factor [Geminicoccus harenae]|uniref:ChrR family anti-sigma-E factor n=2 Tax=Geminicoccus harenae TaxID=2498453 RepID=UPI001C9680C9|nr:ChrR family anti-sigma-E factor [Geminicoccus harenae]